MDANLLGSMGRHTTTLNIYGRMINIHGNIVALTDGLVIFESWSFVYISNWMVVVTVTAKGSQEEARGILSFNSFFKAKKIIEMEA